MTDNPPAFPVPNDANVNGQEGMTLRDYFAGQALPLMLKRALEQIGGLDSPEYAAAYAYRVAEAMLAERKKGGVA